MKPADQFVARAGALAIQCVADSASFQTLRREWSLLHAACPDATPFNSWEWLYSWWQAYGAGRRLRLLTCRIGGELVGIAPLYLVDEKTSIRTSVSVLRMVGDGSGDSDYLGFLIRPDLRALVATELCNSLAKDNCWDAAVIRELHENSTLPQELRRAAEDRKFLFRLELGRCAALELPKTFDDLLAALQPRFRTKLRSLLKKLDQGPLIFEASVTPSDLKERLRSLYALHEARWRGAGHAGVFIERAKRVFYSHFVPRFTRRGWLRLYSLRNRAGDYLAHQLCFGTNGVTYLLQEGFDVSNPSASYGQMLRAAVMRHLIDRGEALYDFLGGFSKHKQDWGAVESRIVHVILARPRLRGWLYFKLPLWRVRLASIARRWLPEWAVRLLKRGREVVS